jgi:hypothetical protein
MGLNNSQKSKIIRIAKAEDYQGDYTDLFKQAEKDKIFDGEDDIKTYKEGGVRKYGAGGENDPNDPFNPNDPNDPPDPQTGDPNTSTGGGSSGGSSGGTYSGGQPGWMQNAGDFILDNIGMPILQYGSSNMLGTGDITTALDRYNAADAKGGMWGAGKQFFGDIAKQQLKNTVTGSLWGGPGKALGQWGLPKLPGGKWLAGKIGWRDGGFKYGDGGGIDESQNKPDDSYLKEDFKPSIKSLLINKTPHTFKDISNFHTSTHTVEPNSRAIIRFLTDEKYKPLQAPAESAQYQTKNNGPIKMSHGGLHPETDKNQYSNNVFNKLPWDNWQEHGLDDWSHIETWDEAYNAAKKWAVHTDKKDYQFTWKGQHKNVDYAGTPEQELKTYGVNDGKGNIIHRTNEETIAVNKYDWGEDSRYPPSHIASYNIKNPTLFIDWASFKKSGTSPTFSKTARGNYTQKGTQTMVFNVDQQQYLKTHLKLQSLTAKELKDQGVLGGTIYKTTKGKKIKDWAGFYEAIQTEDIEGVEAYNFLTNNCADVTADGFALDLNGKKVCKVLGLVDSPTKVLDAIKLKFPTMDISGRDKSAYYLLYRKYEDLLHSNNYDEVLRNSWRLVNGNDKQRSIGILQEALKGKGYKLPKSTTKLGNVDQIWGPETKKALEQWEKDSGYWNRTEKIKMHEGGIGNPGDIGYIAEHSHYNSEGEEFEWADYLNSQGDRYVSQSKGHERTELIDRSDSYISLQQSLIANGYDIELSGSMNTQTKEALHKNGEENLTHLPVWNTDWKLDEVGCTSETCGAQVTDMIMMLYGYDGIINSRKDAGAADSWFREGYMLDNGGQSIWSQKARGTYDDEGNIESGNINFPPMEVWKDFMVGDVVHLQAAGFRDMGNFSKEKRKAGEAKGYSTSYNTSVGHSGLIIGRDSSTGIPLVMHGVGGDMFVERLDKIDWHGSNDARAYVNGTEIDRTQEYVIQGVTRPAGLVNNPNAIPNYSALAPFAEKENKYILNQISFNEDYQNTLSEEELKTTNFFEQYINGYISFESDIYGGVYSNRMPDTYLLNEETIQEVYYSKYGRDKLQEEEKAYNTISYGYGAQLSQYTKNGKIYSREGGDEYITQDNITSIISDQADLAIVQRNSPITRISNVTMFNEKEVAHAASMVYGTFMRETGDIGIISNVQEGLIKTWMKEHFSPETNAQIAAFKNLDITFDENKFVTETQEHPFAPLSLRLLRGAWSATNLNEGSYMSNALSPPSEGIMRIKVPYQIFDADGMPDGEENKGKLNQLGIWYAKMGLIQEDEDGNWIHSLGSGDNLLTGIPGDRGMANSIDAAILFYLHNKHKLRQDKRYNLEDDTFDGVPADYIAIQMHNNPNYDRIAQGGKTPLEWSQEAFRTYSNFAISHSAQVNINSYKFKKALEERGEYTSSNPEGYIFEKSGPTMTTENKSEDDWKFMQSRTTDVVNKYGNVNITSDFFSKSNKYKNKIIDQLQKLSSDKGWQQAAIMIDKLKYGESLKVKHPNFSNQKIMEMIDEHFQVVQPPSKIE